MVNALKSQEIKATGWDDGMCQDYCKPLSQWLSSRMDARYTFHAHTLPHTATLKDAVNAKSGKCPIAATKKGP
jgi:hypothetical protein